MKRGITRGALRSNLNDAKVSQESWDKIFSNGRMPNNSQSGGCPEDTDGKRNEGRGCDDGQCGCNGR